jgi:putative phosphoesterase
VTVLGLISDTHYQDRLFALPARLPELFAGVDLILHAGDVGEFDVLDNLGHIAPVLAVHGNDEPEYVQKWLPYQQLITLHGLRVLLCHTHYSDRAEEIAKRGGPWGPKLDHIAGLGRAVGAQIVVYGHSHVPLLVGCEGVTLVNPGAVAAGSYFTRQVRPSVARLDVFDDGTFAVTHLDLTNGKPVSFPTPNPAEEFGVLAQQYQTWLIEPDLIPAIPELRKIPYEDLRAVLAVLRPLYQRYEHGGLLPRSELVAAVRAESGITEHDRARLLALLDR